MTASPTERNAYRRLANELAAYGLSNHTINTVVRSGEITRATELCHIEDDTLKGWHGLGPKALAEIRTKFSREGFILTGCLDPYFDGTPVRIERPLEPHEYIQFVEEEEPHDWLWITTPRGTTFVRADRVRAA